MWIITNNISILIIPLWILKMLIHRILLIKEGTAMKLGRDYTPIINRGSLPSLPDKWLSFHYFFDRTERTTCLDLPPRSGLPHTAWHPQDYFWLSPINTHSWVSLYTLIPLFPVMVWPGVREARESFQLPCLVPGLGHWQLLSLDLAQCYITLHTSAVISTSKASCSLWQVLPVLRTPISFTNTLSVNPWEKLLLAQAGCSEFALPNLPFISVWRMCLCVWQDWVELLVAYRTPCFRRETFPWPIAFIYLGYFQICTGQKTSITPAGVPGSATGWRCTDNKHSLQGLLVHTE